MYTRAALSMLIYDKLPVYLQFRACYLQCPNANGKFTTFTVELSVDLQQLQIRTVPPLKRQVPFDESLWSINQRGTEESKGMWGLRWWRWEVGHSLIHEWTKFVWSGCHDFRGTPGVPRPETTTKTHFLQTANSVLNEHRHGFSGYDGCIKLDHNYSLFRDPSFILVSRQTQR